MSTGPCRVKPSEIEPALGYLAYAHRLYRRNAAHAVAGNWNGNQRNTAPPPRSASAAAHE